MAAKKTNLYDVFSRVINAEEVPSLWPDSYSPFKYNSKDLHKTYKVPKFKKRFSI